ncbi:hypothetical protein PAPYR_39 [Paratrimastix pyriformis]|uniref:Uncharacterized protein n=1 Tax=Paratrimastix pyriformis TaxID=342808 RepID=A0ABQ8UW90_9EUKA|nr:hypothetical protein PAPYR_39 [Paratrimastix pyriformis]
MEADAEDTLPPQVNQESSSSPAGPKSKPPPPMLSSDSRVDLSPVVAEATAGGSSKWGGLRKALVGEPADTEKPNPALAQKRAEGQRVLKPNGELYPMNTPLKKLAFLGVGVYLLLRWDLEMFWTFIAITVAYLPNLIQNVVLQKANPMGPFTFFSVSQHGTAQVSPLQGAFDLVAALLYFASLLIARYRLPRIEQSIDSHWTQSSDFSVMINGLPPNATPEGVRQMLGTYKGQAVPIRHVALSHANRVLVLALRDANEAKFELGIMKARARPRSPPPPGAEQHNRAKPAEVAKQEAKVNALFAKIGRRAGDLVERFRTAAGGEWFDAHFG